MCFQLYVATTRPIPRRAWERDSSNLAVKSLTAHDSAVKAHFSNPEVQFVGSTSGCGCDFPHVIFQGGAWPYYEDQIDAEQVASDRQNREALLKLLQSTGDSSVELYGIWDGDFAEVPKAYEAISAVTLLNPNFRLKEQGFYSVQIDPC